MAGEPINPYGPGNANYSEWYDRSMNWDGRLAREVPILVDIFGPPDAGGVIDAGCGSGRHAISLAQKGYRVVGADISDEMLTIARRHAAEAGVTMTWVQTAFATMREKTGGGFDGLYCLANSVGATGTAAGTLEAIEQFARCLRPGGRFLLEVLNFTPMLAYEEASATDNAAPSGEAGDGSTTGADSDGAPTDGFLLDPTRLEVTKITIGTEKKPDQPRAGALYPITIQEMNAWTQAVGLRIDDRWGGVLREPFDVSTSIDLIVTGTRV